MGIRLLYSRRRRFLKREQWVAAPWVEKIHTHRITLTSPVFNAAKRVLFVVGGSDKDKAAEAVLEGPFQLNRYPAQIVNPSQGDVVWLLDGRKRAD